MKSKMYQRLQILLRMTPSETDHGPLFWVSTQSALLEMEVVIPIYTVQCCSPTKKYIPMV